ncbi:hypothetical protein KC19_8G113800 [Ceratodon purpureus]|uniref:Uncharacterized protein n=1 Tax=Ceratodon purpureus TaxID=3225 RepID=A0A8T0GXI3_CERPU|nr:hypothetical protein KC19_8G113800 [Ceratodon purpureus]
MMAAFQCEDLREDRREVFEGSTLSLLGSSTYFTPTQTNFAPDAELPASTSTVPSSVYSSTRIQQQISERSDYVGSDAGYFEGEASRDFWSEFYSEPAMDQRGVDEINQEVDDDQMGRPVMESRKRHKGLLGECFWQFLMISTLVPRTSWGKHTSEMRRRGVFTHVQKGEAAEIN